MTWPEQGPHQTKGTENWSRKVQQTRAREIKIFYYIYHTWSLGHTSLLLAYFDITSPQTCYWIQVLDDVDAPYCGELICKAK